MLNSAIHSDSDWAMYQSMCLSLSMFWNLIYFNHHWPLLLKWDPWEDTAFLNIMCINKRIRNTHTWESQQLKQSVPGPLRSYLLTLSAANRWCWSCQSFITAFYGGQDLCKRIFYLLLYSFEALFRERPHSLVPRCFLRAWTPSNFKSLGISASV